MTILDAGISSQIDGTDRTDRAELTIRFGPRLLSVQEETIHVTNDNRPEYPIDGLDLAMSFPYGQGEIGVEYDVRMQQISITCTASQAVTITNKGELLVKITNEGSGRVLAYNEGWGTIHIFNGGSGKVCAYNRGEGSVYSDYRSGEDGFGYETETTIVTNGEEGQVRVHKRGKGTIGFLVDGVEMPVPFPDEDE